ncbi:hypothetical protein MKZ38_007061 [Zalerion maritima]|uniref:Uncharacterized protein n=1 Tax=Zalerion maritima TaxID=339359 RepID=A0AAD5RN32_9PEZI|nr:hypothetical protein MKZ38_007061 [Zalerion maritima]
MTSRNRQGSRSLLSWLKSKLGKIRGSSKTLPRTDRKHTLFRYIDEFWGSHHTPKTRSTRPVVPVQWEGPSSSTSTQPPSTRRAPRRGLGDLQPRGQYQTSYDYGMSRFSTTRSQTTPSFAPDKGGLEATPQLQPPPPTPYARPSQERSPPFSHSTPRLGPGQDHLFNIHDPATVHRPQPSDTILVVDQDAMSAEIRQCGSLLREMYSTDLVVWGMEDAVEEELEEKEQAMRRANELLSLVKEKVDVWWEWAGDGKVGVVEPGMEGQGSAIEPEGGRGGDMVAFTGEQRAFVWDGWAKLAEHPSERYEVD